MDCLDTSKLIASHRVEFSTADTAISLFEAHARHRPNATALVFGDIRLSYLELDRRASALAQTLLDRGIGSRSHVGICMYRSVELIVALLATLKSGAAYVAIDPSYPTQRLADMLTSVPLHLLLTHEDSRENLPAQRPEEICLNAYPSPIAHGAACDVQSTVKQSELCYVVYTSGSTGKPKAASVTHGGWRNLLRWFTREFDITAADRVLIISSFSFDITQRSIMMPLVAGGELHLLAARHYDPALIRAAIRDAGITIVNCAPSAFYSVVEDISDHMAEALHSLRLLFLGGEAISASRLVRWMKQPACTTSIVNVYGAAECSDVSSYYRLVDATDHLDSPVPIGVPIDRTEIRVVDENLNCMPRGEIGEICVLGAGVGPGYLNAPEMTEARFVTVPTPSAFGDRMYRTGDLGKLSTSGELLFIGRVDQQVKLHGMRIHLGEIENAIRQIEPVKEAVVVKKTLDKGDDRLFSFVILQEQASASASDCRLNILQTLRTVLPAHMVPTDCIILGDFPLTPNGKVNRLLLQEMGIPEHRDLAGQRLPGSELEKEIAEIFGSVLKIESVGVDESFFDLGGYSILLTEVLALINERFNAEVSIRHFLADPTVEGIKRALEQSVES